MTKTEPSSKQDKMLAVLADYKRTFETPHGRRVLRRMMKECGVMEPSFVEGDINSTVFNEGRRSVVLEICNRLRVDLRKMETQLTSQSEEDDDYID